jgi:hypothetical protein
MAGFGQTAGAQKEVAKVQQVAPASVKDAFAHLRIEEEKMGQEKMTHMFIGVAGFDGTGKSGIVASAFDEYVKENPNAMMQKTRTSSHGNHGR